MLNIYPREGGTRHPIGGHLYIGENAHPFTGEINGLRFIYEQKMPRGQPKKIGRDMGAYMAYQSFFRNAIRANLTESKAKAFASKKCLELWQKWPGIQDGSGLRLARRHAQNELAGKPRTHFTYTGTKPDWSDYTCLLLLPGATRQATDGKLHIDGPMWVWHWGMEVAEWYERVTAMADVPDAADFGLITVGG